MITVAALEIRRLFRRRMSLLLLIVPFSLALGALILKLLGQPLPAGVFWTCISTSSLVIFCQAMLSDREGRIDMALATARVSGRFPLLRRIFLLIVPVALQLAFFRALAGLFRVT